MSLVRLQSVLWRKINDSSYQALDGSFRGQYEIRLNKTADEGISDFLRDVPEQPTDTGGVTKRVPLSAFEGDPNVGPFTLDITKRGPDSERRDWNIVRQQPGRGYPLWQLSRLGNPSKDSVVDKCYVIIGKDTDGHYHARWLNADDVASLPSELRNALLTSDVGTYVLSSGDSEASRLLRNLRANLNVLLYGPPATGKTHLLNEVIRAFTSAVVLDTSAERHAIFTSDRKTRVAFVTFHQSYTYEEFMVSLMPTDRASHSMLTLQPRPGVLLELARFAMEPDNEALLVIDEINRGNVSRIFGEFITVMERDKRLSDAGETTPTTVRFRLPYYDGNYALPLRLYTLATMNSVDRSVAPLDAALRRRFDTVELMPDLQQLAQLMDVPAWESDAVVMPTDAPSYKVLALRLLRCLNDKIAHFRGTEYQIGQWYLAPMLAADGDVDALRDALHEAWWKRIMPQLEELFAGQVEQLTYILDLRDSARDPMFVDEPNANDQDMGARPVLRKSMKPDLVNAYFVRFIQRSNAEMGGRALASRGEEDEQEPDRGEVAVPEAQTEKAPTDAAP